MSKMAQFPKILRSRLLDQMVWDSGKKGQYIKAKHGPLPTRRPK